jgi:predicted DCC family thiol-disulfide oxidoreductase YuxK
MERRERPVLVFDGDCGFCSSSVRFIERHIPVDADIVPFQTTDLAPLGTTRSRAEREVLWVTRDGEVYGGAAAAAHVLRASSRRAWRPLGRIISVPPISWLAAGVYRVVAINRHRMPGGTPACAIGPGPGAGPGSGPGPGPGARSRP